MKRFTMLCAALAVAACSPDNKNVSDTAGGAMEGGVGAAGDTTGGAMSAGTGGAAGTAGATGTAGAAGTAGTTGGTGTAGASGTGAAGTTGSAPNQTQSGVTNAKTGASTLGPNIKKTEPTQGAPVTRDGKTLKPGGDTVNPRPPR